MKQRNYQRWSRWLLLTLLTFLVGVSPAWAETKTVNDGTETNQYLPVFGNYVDTQNTTSEFIIPAERLEDITGATLSSMTFYLSTSQTGAWGSAVFEVYLKEVSATSYASATANSEGSKTVVYTGSLDGSQSTMDVAFSNNYTYNGGNLLVGFKVTTAGTWKGTYFYGEAMSYGTNCAFHYATSNQSGRDSFLPKVTFTYTPGAGVVKKPTNVIASSITSNSATIGWDAVDGADSYELSCSTSSAEPAEEGSYTPVNANSYSLTGLTGGTLYYVYVRTIKGGDKSKWSTVCSFTPGTLTVNNVSTTTNNYVPIYGNYMDDHSRSQFILPKASLSSLSGTQITKIIFYGSASNTAKFANKTFDVYMEEVDDASISSLSDWATLEQVYSGNLTIIDGKMTVILDEGFDYSGDKNLLIGINQTDDNSDYTSTTWTGVSATGASMGGYGSSINQCNFLPQTTFYFAPQTATVKKPKNLAASATATTTATLSWTDGEDGLTEWQIAYSTATDFNPDSEGTKVAANANPFSLTELTSATTYYAYVRAKKGEEYSGWSNKAEFTTLSAVPVITLSTTSYNFGMVSDADAQALTLTISNTGGAALTGLTVTPTSGFAVTDMEGNALTTTEIAASSTLSVKVKMNALGQQEGNITIDGNEIDAQEVTVSGYMLDDSKIAETFTNAVPDHWTEYAYKSSYSTYNWSYSADGAYNTNENSTLSTPKITIAESQILAVYGKLKSNATYGYILIEGSSDNGETWTSYNKKLDYEAFSNTTNVFQLLTLSDVPTTVNKLRFKCYYAYLNTINGFTYAPDPVLALFSDEECSAAISTVVSKSFGLITETQSEKYYIKNTGTGQIDLIVNEPTGFTATIDDVALTNNEVATLTITMPATEGTHDDAIVVTAKNHDTNDVLGTFTVNATGALRDANKFYQEFNTTSLPAGWTADGTWYYNETNGAYTTAWYIDSGTLTRLKTPMLKVAAGEKFIIEAKGYSTSNTSYQHMVLQYSADGTNWTTFSDDFGTTISENPTNWKSFTATLPNEVEAGNYYIAVLASQTNIRMFYGGEEVAGANFAINTDGSAQDFGSVKFGATAQKSYTVTNNGNVDLLVTLTAEDGFTATGNTMLFTNTKGWSEVKVHAWNDEGNLTEWPGVNAPYYGKNNNNEDQYAIIVPAGATGIVINNGNGQQSNDITDFNKEGYYLSGDLDGNKYWAGSWGDHPTLMNVAAGESEQFTVTMNTATSGEKSGNVVLTFDALNATSFTIPCTGNVKDENYLYVDFADGKPEGWTSGDDWAFTSGYAAQTSTTTESALITTPLTVAENETMTFKVKKNANGTKSLKVRYSADGGANWSKYTNYGSDYGSSFEQKELTGIPAGTVIVEFLANNIIIDDIEGFTKTTAPALALTEAGVAVVNGEINNLGNLNSDKEVIYTLKNIGNATLNATITGEGITATPANVEIAAGETANITVTMAYAEPYGEKIGSMTISSESWVGNFVVNFTADLIDSEAFVEDFTANARPEGWYNGGWTFSNNTASVALGTAKNLITKKLEAAEGKNVLTFKAKYSNDYLSKILNVYTSADRKEWTLQKEVTLTADYVDVALDALTDGNYYVKFEAANAVIDDVKGLKNVDLPEHDLYEISNTMEQTAIPGASYTATVNAVSLRADETVTAQLWIQKGEENAIMVAELTEQEMTVDANKTFTLTGNLPNEEGDFKIWATIFNNDIALTTDKKDITLAHTVSLTITEFENAAAVQADDNNDYTATFNVQVTNTGSKTLAANEVSVNLIDYNDAEHVITATWSAATSNILYMNTKANDTDIAENCTLKAWCWNTAEDGIWATFTNINDGFWSVDLQGKTNFIVCRFNPEGTDENPWNNVWNKSADLSLTNGNLVKFTGYNNESMNFTSDNMASLEPTMSTTLKVTVTGTLTDGENTTLSFKAKENVSDTQYSLSRSANIIAAPVIVLNEEDGTIASTGNNRKVELARTFNAGWNTICVPFAIDDIAAAFGEEAKVYEFTDYNNLTLSFNKVNAIEAGFPYIIYVKQAITTPIAFTHMTVSDAAATEVTKSTCSFKGTYAPIAAPGMEGMWGVTAEGKIAAGSSTAFINGFRAYFDGNLNDARIAIFDEEIPTGVSYLGISEMNSDNDAIYNMSGQRVVNMKKGNLYINNGKKTFRK